MSEENHCADKNSKSSSSKQTLEERPSFNSEISMNYHDNWNISAVDVTSFEQRRRGKNLRQKKQTKQTKHQNKKQHHINKNKIEEN